MLKKSLTRQKDKIILALILVAAGIFLIRFAHFQLASDDLDWLAGRTPTEFDQYRILPRLSFQALNLFFGASPAAALVMIFLFHAINTLLVYLLSLKLSPHHSAGWIAAATFAINPITLSTLTWFSCFSYIQGTTFGLASTLCFIQELQSERKFTWPILTFATYLASLFCSHELLFLPLIYLSISILRAEKTRAGTLGVFVLSAFCGVVVNQYHYRFHELSVSTGSLFDLAFLAAFLSSFLSYPLSLGILYPMSFFFNPMNLLQIGFSEPARWWLTVFCGVAIVLHFDRRSWRRVLAALLALSAVILPYILRLYLMPSNVLYSHEYVLSGRVFYLPFTLLAVGWGLAIKKVASTNNRWLAVVAACFVIAWFVAMIFTYQPSDFLGLSVWKQAEDASTGPVKSWNPLQPSSINGLWWVILAAVATAGLRLIKPLTQKRKHE